MAASVKISAPSKINLHLRVYERRPDGFHGIRSLFQAVSLADTIVVRSLKTINTVAIEGSFDCPAQDTTVYKAITAFRNASGIGTGLSVKVEKVVPAGAGLGGGSGDAAAVLRALDALFDTRFDTKELAAMAATVGSDVPFFVEGGCALVSGRGERVDRMVSREDFALAIHFPGFPMGSAEAYRLLDRMRPEDSGEADPAAEVLKAAYYEDPKLWPFANSFEPFVAVDHPAIAAIRSKMSELGAFFSAMSGSGSSVFGVFPTARAARQAVKSLESFGGSSYLAFPLARLPALD
ncbi:MAG: 4-(cytidine 5'-diphospho)-2-C-methyl-D-erythritol kinase [Treponema sp.]|nr:4-(cytidine 5'-diphospho)-2-C-methyl-D-erythritol kinase [Treponema sp.]